jgi:hypothetical protein
MSNASARAGVTCGQVHQFQILYFLYEINIASGFEGSNKRVLAAQGRPHSTPYACGGIA